MARYTIHCNELGACEVCDHCIEKKHPWYFCGCGNNNFGNIRYPNECDEFDPAEDDDEDEDDNDNDEDEEIIECPGCGEDAYWNGSEYECSNDDCGWCGYP